MPIKKSEAIVLKSIKHSESSKIVTFFTGDYGRIAVLAKGARRPKSEFLGVLEPLNLLFIVFYYRNTRDIQILSQSTILEPFPDIQKDLARLAISLSVTELLNRIIIGEEPSRNIFDLAVQTFREVNRSRKNTINLLWYFEITMLKYLGFKPDLDRCNFCKKPLEKAKLSLQKGQLYCGDCVEVEFASNLSKESISILRRLKNSGGANLETLFSSKLAYNQINKFFHNYLSYHLEGIPPLRSLNLLK
ncbi:MAG: DNA repair protein RecO [Fidelibacterota bacterium]